MEELMKFLARACGFWPQMFDLRMTPPTFDAYTKQHFGVELDAKSARVEEMVPGDFPGCFKCKVVFDVDVKKVGQGEVNVGKLFQ